MWICSIMGPEINGVPGLIASPSSSTPRIAGMPIFRENFSMARVPVKITPSTSITTGSGIWNSGLISGKPNAEASATSGIRQGGRSTDWTT